MLLIRTIRLGQEQLPWTRQLFWMENTQLQEVPRSQLCLKTFKTPNYLRNLPLGWDRRRRSAERYIFVRWSLKARWCTRKEVVIDRKSSSLYVTDANLKSAFHLARSSSAHSVLILSLSKSNVDGVKRQAYGSRILGNTWRSSPPSRDVLGLPV